MGVKPRGQELVRASRAVKGMVRESSRSDRARLKMKMLRAVRISWVVIKGALLYVLTVDQRLTRRWGGSLAEKGQHRDGGRSTQLADMD